jgi:hypothetical protein
MAIYPSQEWCDQWKQAMNNDKRVAQSGKNWGVDFNGNWLFEITPVTGWRRQPTSTSRLQLENAWTPVCLATHLRKSQVFS